MKEYIDKIDEKYEQDRLNGSILEEDIEEEESSHSPKIHKKVEVKPNV